MTQNGTRKTIAICGLILTAGAILGAVVWDAAGTTHETSDSADKLDTLKTEGCLPARENEKALIRIESKFDAFIIEQRASNKTIVEAIKAGSP